MLSKKCTIFMESAIHVIACYWENTEVFLEHRLTNCIFAFKTLQAKGETHPLVL